MRLSCSWLSALQFLSCCGAMCVVAVGRVAATRSLANAHFPPLALCRRLWEEVEQHYSRAAELFAEEGRPTAAAEAAARGARALEEQRSEVGACGGLAARFLLPACLDC